jgi:alpha-beta hydrolase superfamily lysophospholipase
MHASPMAPDPDMRVFRVFRAATREARAFAKLASLLPRDWAASVPSQASPGDDVVVLVHGTLATGGAWRPLRRRLAELDRTHTAVFTYGPAAGVVSVAATLSSVVERLPPRVRVHLVGHSLGGLAVRWFVQEMPSDERVVETISVAAPFSGARGARFFPGPAGRDMRRGSGTLRRLAVTAGVSDVPHLSILGSADTAVSDGTAFPTGERAIVPDTGHNGLLFHEGVARRIIDRLLTLRSDSVRAGEPGP